ncbi:MAG: carboxypeptidase regulatory-like domain-containing protein [Gemmatimonadaceae bacterium]
MRFQSVCLPVLLALLAQPGFAQAPATNPAPAGVIVHGVVRDTIERMPLAGAWVQLSATDTLRKFVRTVPSDSLGRFVFDSVPAGRYAIGFFHPLLDSLGAEPMFRDLVVSGRRAVRMDLTTPSQTLLRAAMCGPQQLPDTATGALFIGVLRDARDRTPVAGAKVKAEWLEFTLQRRKFGGRRQEQRVATTGANGMFVLCHVPWGGSVYVSASRGADTTDVLEFNPTKSGIVRRELYLGASRTVVIADSVLPGDTVAPLVRRVHLGDVRLRGRVVTADGDRPLRGAMVRIADGPETRTNDRGEWTLVNAPAGTRMLEVRAIGYFPTNRPVDAIADAPPLSIPLVTFKAMLDTVRITVSRVQDRSLGKFDERRRGGMGRYITAEELERRGIFWLSDAFRMIPGVRLDGAGFHRVITVRNDFGQNCAPPIYIDGMLMWTLSAFEIDGLLVPRQVRGIEVYRGAFTPFEYQRTVPPCGAILIWTK